MGITINTPVVNITINNPETDLSPILERLNTMSAQIQQALDDLQAKVEAQTTVDQSAVVLLTGLSKQLADAIQAAKDAGATDAQVQGFADLRGKIDTNNQSLAAAVTANTPVATP